MINFDGMIVGGIVHSAGGRRYVYFIQYLHRSPPLSLFLPIQLASLHGSSCIRELRNE